LPPGVVFSRPPKGVFDDFSTTTSFVRLLSPCPAVPVALHEPNPVVTVSSYQRAPAFGPFETPPEAKA
jgi:hypothetical protein